MAKPFKTYAPPMLWGPWEIIDNSAGEMSFKITYSADGNTIVMGKIRYYSQQNKVAEEGFQDEIIIRTGDAIANIEVCFKGLSLGSEVHGEIR